MQGLSVVVLTSRALGVDLAAALSGIPEVRSLTVVTTRVGFRQSFYRKLRRMYLHEGVPGLLEAASRRLHPPAGGYTRDLANVVAEKCPAANHIHYDDLHAPEAVAHLRALAPDLGVVFATYRLRPEVFNAPRMGSLNLHLGRAPEFRGSSPGFYEMLEGVPEVGVTVHRVSEKLDEGPILLQETFPLDIAPPGDPLQYLQRYQTQVLVPGGTRLMVQAVQRIAHGVSEERVQGRGARPRPRATYRLQQELRRRVAERRVAGKAWGSAPTPVRN